MVACPRVPGSGLSRAFLIMSRDVLDNHRRAKFVDDITTWESCGVSGEGEDSTIQAAADEVTEWPEHSKKELNVDNTMKRS